MEKEILKRNIEQVINQPCMAKYPTRVEPNGLSENGKYIMAQVVPDDSMRQIPLTEVILDFVGDI